jgi:hypothetical protein
MNNRNANRTTNRNVNSNKFLTRNTTRTVENKNKVLYIVLVVLLLLTFFILFVVKYTKKGFSSLKFKENKINTKYQSLIKQIGEPTYTEISANNRLNSATWMAPLTNYTPGFVGGATHQNNPDALDYIKLNGFLGRKHHPIAADMFVIAGKYINVPEILIGPFKYASETINIEQLEVPRELNNNFGETQEDDEKGKALVTGSCASVTISAITIKFVEDMITRYNNGEYARLDLVDLHTLFREEYDEAILGYLCKEKDTDIAWFNSEDYGESNQISPIDQCSDKFTNNSNNNKKAS